MYTTLSSANVSLWMQSGHMHTQHTIYLPVTTVFARRLFRCNLSHKLLRHWRRCRINLQISPSEISFADEIKSDEGSSPNAKIVGPTSWIFDVMWTYGVVMYVQNTWSSKCGGSINVETFTLQDNSIIFHKLWTSFEEGALIFSVLHTLTELCGSRLWNHHSDIHTIADNALLRHRKMMTLNPHNNTLQSCITWRWTPCKKVIIIVTDSIYVFPLCFSEFFLDLLLMKVTTYLKGEIMRMFYRK